MEFHISRKAREFYQFDESIFSYNGNVIFANFHSARVFAQKINDKRDLINYPEKAVRASHINALGLLDEIMHIMIKLYKQQVDQNLFSNGLQKIGEELGGSTTENVLSEFTDFFPPEVVYQNKKSVEEFLSDITENEPNRVLSLEEILVLWITNQNPALEEYREFFDDQELAQECAYSETIQILKDYLKYLPPFGPGETNLFDLLLAPALASPNSLFGQLKYIRDHWGHLLGDHLKRLLGSLDMIKEEEKITFFGPGPIAVPTFKGRLGEIENFTQDKDWMPNLILIAKNTYVWLDQLSKKYHHPIETLDKIPDEELDLLAKRGFTGLWLIGLWERSEASAKVKQMCGNPEAIASAYSLKNYSVAEDLGGYQAYQNLKNRCWQRGIRLASDMVPNHMGIDSEWVKYHPDRFLSIDYVPFPSYSFTGTNLSPDDRYGIYLEDHYFDRSDAAVVFKRVDHQSGDTRYIYHGNDGTSMPWNDTAQLNYLNPETREAVIQTIIDVAKMFPIIRFDAAMTLAKKHYQRLWFPSPGSGGDIPTRVDFGLTEDQFDELMPVEFWREVVDRIAVEAPDTLLLAEAFWMMESYFVRTLGMHRVYNSAFMNLLRNEDNIRYRTILKNTLEFDPQILKRYVNFMNNPDERTAIDQFGKEDKYFGTCVLLSTMPGLPMFGHGQIEGFAEKYGMEFKKAYWAEEIDQNLVQRHEKEIFPLLHKRYLFADIENFLFFDFYQSNGTIDENVYAFSNNQNNQHTLVIFNNKYAQTEGWINTAVPFTFKDELGERHTIQRSLAEGLHLHPETGYYVIFKDHISGLEYIRTSKEIADNGMFFNLNAYEYHVFMNIYEIQDDKWHSYQKIYNALNGQGVTSIESAIREFFLQPVANPFKEIANHGYFAYLLDQINAEEKPDQEKILNEASEKFIHLLSGVAKFKTLPLDHLQVLEKEFQTKFTALITLNSQQKTHPLAYHSKIQEMINDVLEWVETAQDKRLTWLGWVFVNSLGGLNNPETHHDPIQSLVWIDEFGLGQIFANTFQTFDLCETTSWKMVGTIKLLTNQQDWYKQSLKSTPQETLKYWLTDQLVLAFLGINRYDGVLWFNGESFYDFINWMKILILMQTSDLQKSNATEAYEYVLAANEILNELLTAVVDTEFRIDKLLSNLE
jgi:glycosidase